MPIIVRNITTMLFRMPAWPAPVLGEGDGLVVTVSIGPGKSGLITVLLFLPVTELCTSSQLNATIMAEYSITDHKKDLTIKLNRFLLYSFIRFDLGNSKIHQ